MPSHCCFSVEYLVPTNTHILTFYVLATILVELFFTKDSETITNDTEIILLQQIHMDLFYHTAGCSHIPILSSIFQSFSLKIGYISVVKLICYNLLHSANWRW